MKHSASALGVLFFVLLLLTPVAFAHGDLQSSDPEAGASVKRAPRSISLTLTEPPGPGTVVRVADGCRRTIAASLSKSGSVVDVELADAQPGRWVVRYRSVSSVDGHVVKGSYRFAVQGKRDCSPQKTSPEDDIAGGEDTRIESDETDNSGGFPVIPFAIGSIVVIAIALILRRATQ